MKAYFKISIFHCYYIVFLKKWMHTAKNIYLFDYWMLQTTSVTEMPTIRKIYNFAFSGLKLFLKKDKVCYLEFRVILICAYRKCHPNDMQTILFNFIIIYICNNRVEGNYFYHLAFMYNR